MPNGQQVKVGVVGMGKMGVSHLAIINAQPGVRLTAICDSSKFVVGAVAKQMDVAGYSDYERMLEKADLDAVIIATPSKLHGPMVARALDKGLHVFCEKPFCMDAEEGAALAERARQLNRVAQVGYHNRFVGSFREVKRLISAGVIGQLTHIHAEAAGAVVLQPQSGGWRSQREQGGGCLYDYAAHPLNLVNWLVGVPRTVDSAILSSIFSADTDDAVYGTFRYENGPSVQLAVNWSDPSVRKMTTRLTIWGTAGRLYADRQEIQLFLRDDLGPPPEGYTTGWNVVYTTELTEPVGFYLRGEEYSAQLESWVDAIQNGRTDVENSFASAVETDLTIAMIVDRAQASGPDERGPIVTAKSPGLFKKFIGLRK